MIDYSRLIVEADGFFNEGQMLCPFCQCTYVHHGHIEIYERVNGEDGESVVLSTLAENPKWSSYPQEMGLNPSPRRNGLRIWFWGECRHEWSLDMYQHKGETFIVVEQLVPSEDDLKTMPYAEYLKTGHWQEVRKAALERADHRCQLCNATENLNVHHRTYERRGAERDSDVTVLCKPCHERFHGVTNGRVTNRVF